MTNAKTTKSSRESFRLITCVDKSKELTMTKRWKSTDIAKQTTLL